MASPSKQGYLRKIMTKLRGDVDPKMWLIKFLPLALMQTLSIFSYTALKNTKNSIFTRGSGATIFTFLKIMIIMPLAIMFPMLIRRITNSLGQEKRDKLPYVLIGIFIAFFVAFALILVPMRSVLQVSTLGATFTKIGFLPASVLQGVGDVIGYWGYSLFYGMSELWATVGINFLAWGVANEICSKSESALFYPLFGLLTNVGGFVAARMMLNSKLSGLGESAFTSKFQTILFIIISALALMLGVYFFIERFVISNPNYVTKKEPKTKVKPNPNEGWSIVLRSPYLRKISMMVIAYNVSIVLFEQCWYDSILSGFGKAAYTPVLAKTTEINSVFTILITLVSAFLGMPWVVKAMLPVIMMGGSGLIFLIMFSFGGSTSAATVAAASSFAVGTSLQLMVILGSLQNISSRSLKYSLFDATKEQLFNVSTDPDIRTKGKAIIDVTVSRVSKSISSWLAVILLAIHPIVSGLFNNAKSNREVISSNETRPKNDMKGALKIAAKSIFRVDQSGNKPRIIIDMDSLDSEKLEAAGFIKEIDSSGKIIISKAKDNETDITTQTSKLSATANTSQGPQKVTTIRDIAPVMLIIVMALIIMWAYAVITIAPEYEANSRETDHSGDGDAKGAKNQGFTPKNIMYLIVISLSISGSLYFWVSREIGTILRVAGK